MAGPEVLRKRAGCNRAPPEAPVVARPRFARPPRQRRGLFSGYVGSVLSRTGIDDETWDELEEAMIRADVGVNATTALLDDLRVRVKAEGITSSGALVEALKDDLKKSLTTADRSLRFEPGGTNVWLFVGVNGVGKTTSIGKVGRQQADDGRSVIMAAGDTFRAAAAEQLELWAARRRRVRAGRGGSRPELGDLRRGRARRGARCRPRPGRHRGPVAHQGQPHGRADKKVRRVAEKGAPGRVTEVLLVIDATTGQNGLVQARQFTDAVEVTGVVLTKLDGTAKGGIALAIQTDLGIPIKLVGLGESAEDLVPFDPDDFVDALFA